jgi:hypothetical protein
MAALDLRDQAWNRRRYDGCKTSDDLRLTTGPGRYMLDPPTQSCGACFPTEPTTRAQMWGASLNSQYIKTDVESDLFNINRPTTRTACDQYNPVTNAVNAAAPVQSKECEFPQVHSRLVDPPCTLRSSGWNRWEWLCQNPQEGVMLPFDNLVTTRLAAKDSYRPCIPTPTGMGAGGPVTATGGAAAADVGALGADTGTMADARASAARAAAMLREGGSVVPGASATVLRGSQYGDALRA